VMVATGGMPSVPPIPGVDASRVISAWDVLCGQRVGRRVLVIGGGMTGLETAEFLAEQGKEVVVVEQLKRVGTDLGGTVRWHMMNRLKGQKIELLTSTEVKEIRSEGVVAVSRKGLEEALEGFDTVVLAVGVKPRNEVAKEIEGKVKELYLVGDAARAGRGLEAIRDGAEAGRRV